MDTNFKNNMQNNNKNISRDQMQAMLNGRPQGVDGKKFIDKFVADGFTVEGVNDTKNKVEKTNPTDPNQKNWLDKVSSRFTEIGEAGKDTFNNLKEIATQEPAKDTAEFLNRTANNQESGAMNASKFVGNTVGLFTDTVGSIADTVANATGISQGIQNVITALPQETQIALGNAILSGEELSKRLFPDDTVRGEAAAALANVLNAAGTVTGASLATKLLKNTAETAAKTAVKSTAVGFETAANAAKGATGALNKVKDTVSPIFFKGKGIARNIATNLDDAASFESSIKALPNNIQRDAARVGIQVSDINTLSKINPKNLPSVKEMFKIADEFASGNKDVDPQQIVGKPLTAKILDLEKQKDSIGVELGKVANTFGPIDTQNIGESILNRLKRVKGLAGLKYDNEGILDFSGTTLSSKFTNADRSAIQQAVSEAMKLDTGKAAHLYRQELFEVLGGKKKALTEMTDTQDKALNAVRGGLSDVLEAADPLYKKLSQQFAVISSPLEKLRKLNKNLTGSNENYQDIMDVSGGLLARRLASNAVSRPEIMKVLEELDNATAVKGGVSTDLTDMVNAYSVFGKYFNISPSNSLGGILNTTVDEAKGITESIISAATKLAGVTPAVRKKMLEKVIDDLLTNSNKKTVVDNIDDVMLLTESSIVTKAAEKRVKQDKDKLVKDLIKANGKTVNTDDARKLFKEDGYVGTNAADVQESASEVAKAAYLKLLKTNKEPVAYIFAGGSGTGKTSAVKNFIDIKNASVILDGNLSGINAANKRINEAIDAGKRPEIVYVYRDPTESWIKGVIKRMNENKEEGGRLVPLSVFVSNHKGSYEVIEKLLDESLYKQGKIDVKMIDNSLGLDKEEVMNPKKFYSINYPESLQDNLLAITKQALSDGTINKIQYEALVK